MNKKLFFVLPIFMATFAFGQSDKVDIRHLVDRQISAGSKGDVDAYMSTIDPKSPAYESTKKAMTAILKTYKLSFKLTSFKILSISGDTAAIQLVTVTKKILGPAFRNNRVKLTATLRKYAGKWVFGNSKIDSIDYL